MPDDTFLEAVLQGRHLRQGHALAVVGGHRQAAHVAQLTALLWRTAQENLDQLVVFAVLADVAAGQRTLQEARQVRGAHAQRPGTVLVDVQVHRLARFFPVQVHVDHMRVLAHLGRHLAGQGANLLDVFAGDTELHRIAYGRAVFQARDP